MSIPKNFLDLMRSVGIPRARTAFRADSGPLPDNDWVEVVIGEAVNVFMEADANANKVLGVAEDSGVSDSLLFHLSPDDGVIVFPYPFAAGASIWATADTGASGAHLHIMGWRPITGGLAT
jgi:hypothetical protein